MFAVTGTGNGYGIDLHMGIYQHYKGPLYLVSGLGHDADADEFYDEHGRKLFPDGRVTVDYVGLQLDAAHLGPRKAVRTLDWFGEWVCADPSHDSYGQPSSTGSCLVRRFTYLGPELTADMLPEDVSRG